MLDAIKLYPWLVFRTTLCYFLNIHIWEYDQTELGNGFRSCACGVQEQLVPDYSRFHALYGSHLVPGGPRGVYEAKWARL